MTRTTSGQYWQRLDHLRGIAAFMVFAWHFIHVQGVVPATDPSLLSIFEEGHTGVSLFLVLSGYLFAKIVGDDTIAFRPFIYSRLLRLGPMLLLGLAAAYITHPQRWIEIPLGLVQPGLWRNGCWTVAVELQLYLLLPLLLWTLRRWPAAALAVVALSTAGRVAIYAAGGDLQFYAYYSLLGRIDQFVLGIAAWRLIRGRPLSAPAFAIGFGAFLLALHVFNLRGGFIGTASSPLWIWWPTVEALGYAMLITWYDGGTWSLPRPFAFAGKVSYSMYILHYVFFRPIGAFALKTFHAHSFYPMFLLSIAAYVLLLPVAWAGWRLIETPAMRRRRPYLLSQSAAEAPGAGPQEVGQGRAA